MTIIGDDTRLNVLATDQSHHRPCCGRIQPQCDRTYNTYFISDGKIRIIRVRKNGLKYVKIRLLFIIYKHSLTNKYRKLLNAVVSCFQVTAKQAVDYRNMVRVKVWHTHTTVWLLKNYSERILTYYTRILLLDLTYGRTMHSTRV